MQAADDIELKKAFFLESMDILDKVPTDLEILEKNPLAFESINTIFRALHTIKGNSSFLNFEKITSLAHAAENMLDKFRKKELRLDAVGIELIRRIFRELGSMIETQEVARDVSGYLAMIADYLRGVRALPQDISHINDTIAKISTGAFVRVDEQKINKIVGLVSELEIVRHLLEKIPERLEVFGSAGEELRFDAELQITKLVRLSKSLSGIVYGVRLVPVNTIFQRFPRVVKELASKLGKEINLRILNGEAELDKNIIEAITDPMTHLIRNSADHGIEAADDRLKSGKRAAGTITLNSFVQGNFVYIEICDDGRGIDGNKVLKKAIEKGIVSEDKAKDFTDTQKRALIFAPGFSTADNITDISGRGVGMDVVKSNINKLKGTVIVDSIVGKGTVIQLRFPMSLAVLFSLFVQIQDTTCALPMDQIDESFDYNKDELLLRIPEGAATEEYLKLYSIRKMLWGQAETTKETYHVVRFRGKSGANIGFIVDDFVSLEEAIVQSVDSFVATLPGIQGASIRKDGSIALMLNPVNLLELSQRMKPYAVAKLKPKIAEATGGLSDFLGPEGLST